MNEDRARQQAAEDLVRELYGDRVDVNGQPATDHMRRVAEGVAPNLRTVAWLHDVVEDGHMGLSDVAARIGLSPVEERALGLLTHVASATYDDYIAQIATADGEAGRIARSVKRADVRANLARVRHPAKEHLRERYETALRRLGEG